MFYQVSPKIQTALAALTADEGVKKALAFQERDQEEILQKQMELTLIPAPTYHEEKKAVRLLEMFAAEGLTNCHMDEYGNAVAVRRGAGEGKPILLEAHMDTVFPLDTELSIRREDGWIYCPGITDDTRGLAEVLSVIRALNAAGIQTKGDIQVVGTVQEEGLGGLKGMDYYVTHHPELAASVSVDGPGWFGCQYRATAIQTVEVTFHGKGGHAYMAFGKVANPIHTAARAVAKIADIRVPESPRATFAVSNFHAGNMSAVHAIVDTASFVVNYRANTVKDLNDLHDQIFAAVDAACKEETDRWGQDEITYTLNWICQVGTGEQDEHAPIVECAVAASRYLGVEEPKLPKDGCTNANRAIEHGLPAVCLGTEDYDPYIHSLKERFREKDAFKGAQQALLVALLCAGTGSVESILD